MPRNDGRCIGTLAAQMNRIRELTPTLAFSKEHCKSPEAFASWRKKVIQQLKVRFQMPVATDELPLWFKHR